MIVKDTRLALRIGALLAWAAAALYALIVLGIPYPDLAVERAMFALAGVAYLGGGAILWRGPFLHRREGWPGAGPHALTRHAVTSASRAVRGVTRGNHEVQRWKSPRTPGSRRSCASTATSPT
jgi:hypothetical protein